MSVVVFVYRKNYSLSLVCIKFIVSLLKYILKLVILKLLLISSYKCDFFQVLSHQFYFLLDYYIIMQV
jgi:hypothetical protein